MNKLDIDTNPAFVEELRQLMLKNYAAWTNNSGQPDYQTLRRFYEEAGENLVMYDPQPPLEGYTGWKNIEKHIQEIVFNQLKSLTLTMNDDFRAWRKGDVAWSTFTANVAVTTKDGQSSSLDYRQSNVWVHHNDEWLIVHENASAPVPIAAKNYEATIRQLTEQWIKGWSPGAEKFDTEKLRPLFAQGDGELLVFDDIGDRVAVLHSWDEYRQTWEPFMQEFAYWAIQPEGEIQVLVDGEIAVTTFIWVGKGRYKDGREITPRQHATHVWRKRAGRWVIVHEHLTVGSK